MQVVVKLLINNFFGFQSSPARKVIECAFRRWKARLGCLRRDMVVNLKNCLQWFSNALLSIKMTYPNILCLLTLVIKTSRILQYFIVRIIFGCDFECKVCEQFEALLNPACNRFHGFIYFLKIFLKISVSFVQPLY